MSDTTDMLHGDESLMDDISSVLGQDVFGADASLTEDTMTVCAAAEIAGIGHRRSASTKRRSLKGNRGGGSQSKCVVERKASLVRMESEETDEQFGFANIVFEIDNRCDDQKKAQPARFCSLARFVEGSDIARKSFKRPTTMSTNLRRLSATAHRSIDNTDDKLDTVELTGNEITKVAHEMPAPQRSNRHISFDDSCKKDDGDEVSNDDSMMIANTQHHYA